MYYLIGDIHGYLDKLASLFNKLDKQLTPQDVLIFLGDYIDRGPSSYEVVELLISISKKHKTVFLKGNHESMFLDYLNGVDTSGIFLMNGGNTTMLSYNRNRGGFKVPRHHMSFFEKLRLYYEGEDFIAVHAGLNPNIDRLTDQEEHDLIWIREPFFQSNKKWKKTIIFGHTPTAMFSEKGLIHIDKKRNIIGIDSGVIFGRDLVCLRWPDKDIVSS